MPADPTQQSRAVIVRVLVASGFMMMAAGIILGVWLGPIFFLIAAIGVADFVLAGAFHSGYIGGVGAQPIPANETEPATADTVAGEASDDPSYNPDPSRNPYARED